MSSRLRAWPVLVAAWPELACGAALLARLYGALPGTCDIVGSGCGIAQNRIGLVEQLDVLVPRLSVQIRVIFTYKTAVGAFDFGNRRCR